ncbi:hypothetical protein Zmor_021003 [Zophobas morio]|uniref:Uncharacterized protein n=1 Tax=Zophobas morio TaxID=2755281 RepID=A0AA38MA74_9CUCU|nr:hypothetical protein Zmor_021003 [Zophobas morio]
MGRSLFLDQHITIANPRDRVIPPACVIKLLRWMDASHNGWKTLSLPGSKITILSTKAAKGTTQKSKTISILFLCRRPLYHCVDCNNNDNNMIVFIDTTGITKLPL